MTKQQLIHNYWSDLGIILLISEYDFNGWIDVNELEKHQLTNKLEFKKYTEPDSDIETMLCRPKLLKGIEHNFGWKKIEDESSLPDHSTLVIGYSEEWIHEDFNPSGERQCHYLGIYPDELKWISAKWIDHQDTWGNDERTKPTHWRNLASFPKPIY